MDPRYAIPTGDWCVIRISKQEPDSKGEIVEANLSQKLAHTLARELNEDSAGYWGYSAIQQNKFF